MKVTQKELRMLISHYALLISTATVGADQAPKDWIKDQLDRMTEICADLEK